MYLLREQQASMLLISNQAQQICHQIFLQIITIMQDRLMIILQYGETRMEQIIIIPWNNGKIIRARKTIHPNLRHQLLH